jgi:hypothetical protein
MRYRQGPRQPSVVDTKAGGANARPSNVLISPAATDRLLPRAPKAKPVIQSPSRSTASRSAAAPATAFARTQLLADLLH